VGREERNRIVISGMEPRCIAVVMLLPREISWAYERMVSIITRSRPQVSFAHGALFVIHNELGVGNSLLLDAGHT
jgi:hypothetical protein